MLKYVVVLILSPSFFATIALSQSNPAQANALQLSRVNAARDATINGQSSDLQQRMEREQMARVIVERQLQLRRDTEKLVALTAELKQHVDKAGANILSMDVIKKAEEIQKLAKSVQDKMKNAY